jgi:glycosyltransferase 2 family protein
MPVRPIPRFIPYTLVLAFAAWCAYSLRGDLAKLSLAPVLRSWDIVVLATFLSLLNYVLRVLRWRAYLTRLGHPMPRIFAGLTYTAGFAYTLSPGKVGEMVKARYYLPLGIPLSDVAAAFFTERLMDLMVMVVLAALLLTAFSSYQGAVAGAALLVAASLASLALVPWTKLAAWIGTLTWIPRPLHSLLAGLASALVSTRPLLSPRLLAFGFLAGLFAWGFEGVGLGLLGSVYPQVHLDIFTAVGIYGIAVLIGGLSLLPGGLGSTEAVMTALLVTRGYTVSQALLVTLLCRLVTLWFAVCLGWLAVLALRQRTPGAVATWR